jgi:hypothetical protein
MHRPGAHCLVGARKRGNARGAKEAGHPRRDGVNGQPEELLVLAEAGGLPRGGTSRMNREIHVRICGGLGVKSPGLPGKSPANVNHQKESGRIAAYEDTVEASTNDHSNCLLDAFLRLFRIQPSLSWLGHGLGFRRLSFSVCRGRFLSYPNLPRSQRERPVLVPWSTPLAHPLPRRRQEQSSVKWD